MGVGKFKAALLRMLGAGRCVVLITAAPALASEADLAIPDLHKGRFFTTPGDPDSGITRVEPARRRRPGHLRHAGHQPVPARADRQSAGA